MAGDALIRELRQQDAAASARVQAEVNPHQVVTAELVWHRATRGIEREKRRTWVAELDGEILGFAEAGFEWSVPTEGKGRFWLGVLPDRRERGIGRALYDTVEDYLRAEGAWRLRTWVDDDPEGAAFLERRGFEPDGVDKVSQLDLHDVELAELPVAEGYRLVPLAGARDRVDELFAICAAGELDMPGEEPETELSREDWKRDDFAQAALSQDGSFVALAGERAVALTLLAVDPERHVAYNRMTATLPEFRRRGLAFALKVASARWAAENGYDRVITENDATNAGMLAINERLGYRPLYDQVAWTLELR